MSDKVRDKAIAEAKRSAEELDKELSDLSPEEAEMFVSALTLAMKKRRLMLVGNLASILIIIFGMLGAFYVYGGQQAGTMALWVFLVPFALAGGSMILFARLAKRLK